MSTTQEENGVVSRPVTIASPSLVERLDPALGEATSGISILMTELVRRTLRGGVQKVDEELQGVVDEKVSATVARQIPVIEAAAHNVAESTARNVAAEEVETLERETREITARLSEQIVESEERANANARSYIATEIESTRAAVDHEISDVERRAMENARALFDQQVDALKQKSKSVVDALNENMGAVVERVNSLKDLLTAEAESREESISTLRSESGAASQDLRAKLHEHVSVLQKQLQEVAVQQAARLSDHVRKLEARLAELEKPRGIRALWLRLFGRKKKDVADTPGDNLFPV